MQSSVLSRFARKITRKVPKRSTTKPIKIKGIVKRAMEMSNTLDIEITFDEHSKIIYSIHYSYSKFLTFIFIEGLFEALIISGRYNMKITFKYMISRLCNPTLCYGGNLQ